MPLRTISVESTDPGRVRARNEDAIRTDGDNGIAVVADGMGGHPAGDVASRLAVDAALDELLELRERILQGESSQETWGEDMDGAVRRVDQRVRQAGVDDPALHGMGTTLTALLVMPDGLALIGHVGDSRAYRFRDGRLQQLTHDQTWVQEQVDAGRMSPEEARVHPYSSVLTQAVGVDAPAEPEVTEARAEPGDVFLVCSDGLLAMLEDHEIEALFGDRAEDGLDAVVEALVEAANERGGWDNITIALLQATPA